MREHSTEKYLAEALEKTPVGEELKIRFSGIPTLIEVEIKFIGGWAIKQSIAPGMELKLVKGEGQYLEDINITIDEYEGLK